MKMIYLAVALVVLLGGGFFLLRSQQSSTAPTPSPVAQQPKDNLQYVFENPKKSAHYETNTPDHGLILAGVPINVVIDFNFDLAKPSSIKIQKDQKDYGIGETIIDDNKLSMRRNMDPASPDGLYNIEYGWVIILYSHFNN